MSQPTHTTRTTDGAPQGCRGALEQGDEGHTCRTYTTMHYSNGAVFHYCDDHPANGTYFADRSDDALAFAVGAAPVGTDFSEATVIADPQVKRTWLVRTLTADFIVYLPGHYIFANGDVDEYGPGEVGPAR